MKVIAIVVVPNEGMKPIRIDGEQGINQFDDYNIRHLIVENKQFEINKETGLQITCAFHLDWCLKNVVDSYLTEELYDPLDVEGIIEAIDELDKE